MKIKSLQKISTILLFVLAFSCSGLSLGMIAHSATDIMSGMDMEMSTEIHACCGLGENQMDTSDTGSMVHNTIQIIGAPEQITILFVIILFTLFAEQILTAGISITQRLYMKKWKQQYSYLSLLYRRLFSTGLLHTKVY